MDYNFGNVEYVDNSFKREGSGVKTVPTGRFPETGVKSNVSETPKPRRTGNLQLPDPSVFRIDQDNLDKEWNRQSVIAQQIAELAARARVSYERARRVYDVTRSDVSQDIRRNPAKYGYSNRPTEATIEAGVTTDPRVEEAFQKMIDARYDFDLCNGAVTAIEHKKKALEFLSQLRTIHYYSTK